MLDVGTCNSGTWSGWKDKDNPSGNCDCEEMSQLTDDYDDSGLCSNPTGTQARIKGSSAMSTTEDVRFGLNGLRCWNVDQADGRCEDYEVRFCCDSRKYQLNIIYDKFKYISLSCRRRSNVPVM